ncbi:hypothetical protein ASL14_03355 [Paenibacillus sp. IHB B 3084]|uniref:PD40 domain-containing protein n=1 Tax=Paenibacillus sp. IHB B 3084 TaxID=867076 RepID=UPI000722BD99|nr:PD40 domain-containing protein [Paenibacillus sp. IHB B 3084]ALP35358.1 hypothetical protein ASL14_03355 [Paenibacillus sp. IHB B 3084]
MNVNIHSKLGKTGLILLATAILLSMTACSTGNTEARQVVEKSGKKITVMDNTTESVYTKLKLEGIAKIEGVRGMDWVSEGTLAVDKQNRKLSPVIIEGEKRYPHNLYQYDLASSGETPLLEGENSYGFAKLSPDRKHMLYQQLYESTGIGYIMNLETGVSVKMYDAEFMAGEGVWEDTGHVIFPNMEGDIIRADVNGKSEVAVKTGQRSVSSVAQSGNMIYYVAMGELIAYDIETKQSEVLKKNVWVVLPSPDGSKLAVVKHTKPGENVLVLCDTKGKELSTLASGMQLFGTSWSPDGSKLAYAVSEDGDKYRFFITEAETGEQTPVLGDNGISDQLRWSPSGKKLLIPTGVLKDTRYQSTAYVIKLS